MLGAAFALSSALFWSVAVILFKKSGEVFSPIALNLYKSIVALVLISLTMVLLGIPFVPDAPVGDWLLLAVSGFLGITLADIFFFMALNRLGAGLVAVVECFYLPSVLVFSLVLLNEQMSPGGYLGSVLVLSAILVGSWQTDGARISDNPSAWTGLFAGMLSMVFMGLGIVMIKGVLVYADVFWATQVRVLAGCLTLFAMAAFHPARSRIIRELKFSKAWLTALPASVCGNFIALVCWVAGMKYTTASQAATLNQMSTIFIFILAAVWLKERITVQKSLAICLAVTGAYMTIFS